jgi:predicted phage terminase large subunit-like protein
MNSSTILLDYFKDPKNRERFLIDNPDLLRQYAERCNAFVHKLPFAKFAEFQVLLHDPEAQLKGWKGIEFQNTLGNIWSTYRKSRVLAPREHLKTTSVLAYLLKRIFLRTYPLEINYYHLNEKMAAEKLRKLRRIIEINPLFSQFLQLDQAKSIREDQIILADGTIIQPLSWEMGVVGKHPHIIVLDDVIDRKVIYSDEANQKSIDKFYTDIYPMISSDDPEKQIIIIGTAQRQDDLYHKLPADFHCQTYKAISNEEKKEVLAPDLFSFQQLTKIRSDISQTQGERFWLKEYQNIPMSAQGLIFKPEDIRYYTTPPKNLMKFQGWDLAVGKDIEKGDWTVCVTIGVDNSNKDKVKVYILDIYRARISFGERLKMIGKKFNEFKPQLVGIEEVAFQYDTIQALKESTLMPIHGVKALTNKIQSFQTELAPYFENDQIYVKEEHTDFIKELLAIPAGEYDDQADALKIAIKTALQEPVKPRIRVI